MNATTWKMSRWLLGLTVLGAMLVGSAAWAIPAQLTVQGQLTNDAGQPGQGSYTLTFALYGAAEGGEAIWTEIQPSVEVIGGIFDTQLGADPINPLLPGTFMDHSQVWLGVTVETGPGVPQGGEDELPRQPMTTVGYAFAATAAESAAALTCTACVGQVQLAFDPVTQNELTQSLANIQIESVDGMGGGTIDGDVTVTGALAANALYVGNNEVCDSSGNCGGAAGELPPDGLDEISNGLLSNQFQNAYAAAGPVNIPDNFAPGVNDTIQVPNVGIAQNIAISVNLTSSGLDGVTLTLYAPDNTQYVLFDKNNGGTQLGATYPDPDVPLSGDLTEWVGKNPQGGWTLNASDTVYSGGPQGADDGAINSWSISFQTLSNQQVQVQGDLIVTGEIIAANQGGTIATDGSLDNTTCDSSESGSMRMFQGIFQWCNGRVWSKMNGAMYRRAVFYTYDIQSTWHGDNQPEHFGGVHPSNWSDGNACVDQMSSNSEVLRRIFHDDGPPIGTVSNSTVWSRRTGYTSSTGSEHAFALFRVHNSTDSNINWNARFFGTAYPSWNNYLSVAVNGNNVFCPGNNYGASSAHDVNIDIPANRTSTVIFSTSTYTDWSSTMSNVLIFKDNSLDLPAGLEFVDDLDVKPDGWEH